MTSKFSCTKCKKIFSTKHLLFKHGERKRSCYYDRLETINDQIQIINSKIKICDESSLKSYNFRCKYCNILYSNKSNLKKHIFNNCDKRDEIIVKLNLYKEELINVENEISIIEKGNNDKDDKDDKQNNNKEILENNEDIESDTSDEDDEDDEEYNKLDKRTLIKMLKKSEKKKNTQNIINNTTINNNNTQNITNNIQINLNNYDEPKCDFLTIEQKNKFLKDRYKGLIDFITYVYFNEAYPENHTILYTNLRSKFGQIYKNNKWIIEEIDLIADNLNKQSFDKFNEHLENLKHDKKYAELYKKEIDKGIAFMNHYMCNDTSKQSTTNIKKTLYNNKDIIIETKNKNIKKKINN